MYKFRFKHKVLEDYFYTNVYDPKRMSIKECIEKELPYIDLETGYIVNTIAFQKEAGLHYKEKGAYPIFPYKSKAYYDYWKEEKRKCREGVWLGQVRIPGDYYYFLNFHSMVMGNSENQEVRSIGSFRLHQFNFFHLYEYCRKVGKNLALIKPRGCGLTEGACSISENNLYNPYVDPVTGKPSFNSQIAYAFDKSYLAGDGKLFDLTYQNTEWINSQGPQKCGLYKNFEHTKKIDGMHLIPGVISAGGKGNKIQHGGSFQCEVVKKPDEVRGGRKQLLMVEEAGSMPILGSVLTKLLPSTKRFGSRTGMLLIWGTSNADSRGIEAFISVLTNPDIYECVKVEDIWKDLDNVENEHRVANLPLYVFEYIIPDEVEEEGVGWFIPYFDSINDDESYNKDGFPDRVKAWNKILAERAKKLAKATGTSSEKDVLEDIADHPVTMQEAFFVSGTNDFDRNKLAKQYQEITIINRNDYKAEIGNLYLKKSDNKNITGVEWDKTNNGKVQIFQHPIKNPDGTPYMNLYCGGYDGIDNGSDSSQSGETGSKMATLIKMRTFGLQGNKYVAMYHDRPGDERDGWEIILALCMYFNLQWGLNIEDTKGGIKQYFKEWNSKHYLMPRPRVALPTARRNTSGLIGTPSGNKDLYIHQKNLVKYYVSDYADRLVFPKQIEQLLNYSEEKKGQFDLVAAMMMCELADEEMMSKRILYDEVDNNVMKSDVGVYYDSTGRKRYGVIPSKENNAKIQYENKIKPLYTDVFNREYHN